MIVMTIELRSYQEESLNAMFGKPSFLLLDEPGLGKTVVQVKELLKLGCSTNLIACPVTAMGVWEYHLKLLIPRMEILKWPKPPEYGCTTLITLGNLFARAKPGEPKKVLRVRQELERLNWEAFIIDEVHGIKNRNAKQTRAAKRIRKVEFRRGLTGTLTDNTPEELWSPLNWGWRKEFRGFHAFADEFIEYETDHWGFKHIKGPKNVPRLREILFGEGRAIRHLKSDVMPELPDKFYTYIPLDMTPKQRRAYEEMRREQLAWVGNQDPLQPLPAPVVIAKLIRLVQFADAYAEISSEGMARLSEPSNKLDALMELLEGRNAPVVVFSISAQLLVLAAARLRKRGYSFGIIKGDVSADQRTKLTEQFQAGELDVMLCQTRSGGVSITLTAATTAIFMDRDWAPGANEQAEDRLHRWGQQNAVEIIILQSRNTIEQYKEQKLELKKSWIQQILN